MSITRRNLLKGTIGAGITSIFPSSVLKTFTKQVNPSQLNSLLLLISPLLSHMEIVNPAIDTDTTGDKYNSKLHDYSSFNGALDNGYGNLPNGDEFYVQKTENGNHYLTVYDMNDNGGERHIVYIDPKTNKAVDLYDYLSVGDEVDFKLLLPKKMDLKFLPDEFKKPISNFPAGEYVYDSFDIDDIDLLIDNIIKFGNINNYFKHLENISRKQQNTNQTPNNSELNIIKSRAGIKDTGQTSNTSSSSQLSKSTAGVFLRKIISKLDNMVNWDKKEPNQSTPPSNKPAVPALPAPVVNPDNIITQMQGELGRKLTNQEIDLVKQEINKHKISKS